MPICFLALGHTSETWLGQQRCEPLGICRTVLVFYKMLISICDRIRQQHWHIRHFKEHCARVKLVTFMIQLANYIFITILCYYKLQLKNISKCFPWVFLQQQQKLKNLVCHYQSMVTADLIVKTILAKSKTKQRFTLHCS